MKHSIEWHEEGQKNFKRNLDLRKEQIGRDMARYEADMDRWRFRQFQIMMAKDEGKDGFDEERYKVRRRAGA